MTYGSRERAEKSIVPVGLLYRHHTALDLPRARYAQDQYVMFAASRRVIIKPVESDITQRDVAEAGRDCSARQIRGAG